MGNVISFQKYKDKRDVVKNNIVAGGSIKVNKIILAQLLGEIKSTGINGDESYPGYCLNGDDKNDS
jgi:hypothetical protein